MYIYIHIPFCTNICNYCDFPKVLKDNKYTNTYLDSLSKEIKERYEGEEITSIFIGGGTPTSLDLPELKKLLELTNTFNKKKNIEFTIESNIENLTEEKIKLLKQYGVNRISLGVQSLNNNILKELGRHHTKEMTIKVINTLKKYNFKNISIDYMYGITNNIEIIKKDLDLFLQLDIPHISCYSLIIEENTIFSINKRNYIDEDIEYQMYKYIEETLTNHNYIHYEVSNYSKKNYQSIHNLNYWNNGEYYGFGLGATSYLNNYRITNTKNLTQYLKTPTTSEKIYEDINLQISNTLILGLRKVNGINILDFKNKYNKDITTLYNIKDLILEEKLLLENNHLLINPKYYYLSNEILINFI